MGISAQSIEKDLADLWKPLEGESKDLGLQRVYTTNMVAYASNHDEGYRVEQILNDLAEKQPGRYILVRPAADTTESSLRSYVSGHCLFNTGKEKRVCCDLIKLVAQPGVIENLYGFTFSLLMPDLPVEFWWPGDLPYENAYFEKMALASNRVWVDSSKFQKPIHALSRLAAFWHSRFPHCFLGDLNWVRIQRWRALIAELFDGQWAPYLKRIRKVTIEHGSGNQPTRSLFLACWLGSQLGWKYSGTRMAEFADRLDFETPTGKVEVHLKPVPVNDARWDRIFAVGIETNGDKPGLFTVIRDSDPHCVIARTEIDHKVGFQRTVSFDHLHTNELLDLGLKHLEDDLVWRRALEMVGTTLIKPKLTL
ncbi:MAG TPA: glucose-6-phosphate dehydrogenase assembly protein OpcA [bacterium]|nr:glucose-6-phosphate dehydrogenase assembly protein OpcA [bacterium]